MYIGLSESASTKPWTNITESFSSSIWYEMEVKISECSCKLGLKTGWPEAGFTATIDIIGKVLHNVEWIPYITIILKAIFYFEPLS